MPARLIDPADIVALGVPNYAHGALTEGAARWLHLSGQVGVKPDGSTEHGFEAQCRRAFSNIGACLRDAGMGFGDVTMLRIYLTHREDLAALRAIRAEFFGDRRLPSTLVFVSGLVNPDWRVELEIVAAEA